MKNYYLKPSSIKGAYFIQYDMWGLPFFPIMVGYATSKEEALEKIKNLKRPIICIEEDND